MRLITEGKARFYSEIAKVVSKQMPVFYNPEMKLNRDLTVLLLDSTRKKQMQITDPLAGTGIRSIRFLKELGKGKIRRVAINDSSPEAVKLIKKNLQLNKIRMSKKVTVSNEDANLFLLKSSGFDYIDIDPFGYPGRFLAAAVQRLARGGVLGVTATDTSALSGTVPNACMRKYWAKPLKNSNMHETGLRILVRFVQLIGAQFEKALVPVFCYSKQHYMRAFFVCEKGRTKVDNVLKQHRFLCLRNECTGPIWTGKLWDSKLVKKMLSLAEEKETRNFLKLVAEESKVNIAGFYDIHDICKKNNLMIPKTEQIMKKIKQRGYKVARTHFSHTGIRSNISLKALISIIKTKSL